MQLFLTSPPVNTHRILYLSAISFLYKYLDSMSFTVSREILNELIWTGGTFTTFVTETKQHLCSHVKQKLSFLWMCRYSLTFSHIVYLVNQQQHSSVAWAILGSWRLYNFHILIRCLIISHKQSFFSCHWVYWLLSAALLPQLEHSPHQAKVLITIIVGFDLLLQTNLQHDYTPSAHFPSSW